MQVKVIHLPREMYTSLHLQQPPWYQERHPTHKHHAVIATSLIYPVIVILSCKLKPENSYFVEMADVSHAWERDIWVETVEQIIAVIVVKGIIIQASAAILFSHEVQLIVMHQGHPPVVKLLWMGLKFLQHCRARVFPHIFSRHSIPANLCLLHHIHQHHCILIQTKPSFSRLP